MKNESVTRHIIQLLRQKAISVTDARVRITAIIYKAERWISLSDILQEVDSQFDRATVYRVLCRLCDFGFVSKLVDIEKISYYMFNYPQFDAAEAKPVPNFEEHTYFKCMCCGSITLLPGHDIFIHLPEGFVKKGSNLLISGYCDKCTPARN